MTRVFACCRVELSQKPAKKLIALRSVMSMRAPASKKSGRQLSVPGIEYPRGFESGVDEAVESTAAEN
jgi:hypothetical protein